MKRNTLVNIYLLFFCPLYVHANIDVEPKIIVVKKNPVSIQIINHSVHPEYVSITLPQILNPGVKIQKEQLEPMGSIHYPSLFVSTFKLSLAPMQSKYIAIKPLRNVTKETVYRLNITPISPIKITHYRKDDTNINVEVGFSLIVRHLPDKTISGLTMKCDKTGTVLKNTGNIRYTLKNVVIDGKNIAEIHVYPGVPLHLLGKNIIIPGHSSCH